MFESTSQAPRDGTSTKDDSLSHRNEQHDTPKLSVPRKDQPPSDSTLGSIKRLNLHEAQILTWQSQGSQPSAVASVASKKNQTVSPNGQFQSTGLTTLIVKGSGSGESSSSSCLHTSTNRYSVILRSVRLCLPAKDHQTLSNFRVKSSGSIRLHCAKFRDSSQISTHDAPHGGLPARLAGTCRDSRLLRKTHEPK